MKPFFLLISSIVIGLASSWSQTSLQPQQSKEALLIANGDYAHFGKLPNPITDARLLGESLQKIGFQVTLVENATREGMLDALTAFQDRLKATHGMALFHYGGHGVQVGGRNFLIPADADISDERKVATRAVDLEEVMTTLIASGASVNVVVLDACRDNPLPKTAYRSASRGLTVVEIKPKNSIIVYAAEAGSKAEDGLFTPTLANVLTEPGLTLSQVMMKVRREVAQKSNGNQTPGEYNQLFEDVYLAGGNAPPPVPQATSQIQQGALLAGPLIHKLDDRVRTNVSMEPYGQLPRDVVLNYYKDLNQGNFTGAWGALPTSLQQNKRIHPEGYDSFKSWFQGITPIVILESKVVEEDTNDAIVDIQCTFKMNGKTSSMSLRYVLARDTSVNRWMISSVKTNSQTPGKKLFVSGLDPNGDNWLALKSGPELKATRLRKLPPDTPLTLLSRSGEWTRVLLDDGQEGWVYSKYVQSR